MKTKTKTPSRKYARLRKLIEFMKTVPRKRFDFCHWVGDDWEGKADLSCGTTACALGWACSIPAFRKAGLKLTIEHWDTSGHKVGIPVFQKATSEDAGANFFGVPDEAAYQLFIPVDDEERVTPKQWAKRAEHILKNIEAGAYDSPTEVEQG